MSVSPEVESARLGVYGQLFHCPVRGEFEFLPAALVLVNECGAIIAVRTPAADGEAAVATEVAFLESRRRLRRLTESQYLLPGMVDLHVHAPQFSQAGKGLDLPLAHWLQQYTFPLEARFSDETFAQRIYPKVVETLLHNGTTSAVYFATIHPGTSLLLARECLRQGQRGFVGKVSMDNADQCPPFYIESTDDGLLAAEQHIKDVLALPGNERRLVSPVVTPRFVPSCTDEMLRGLGDIAKCHDAHIQTHCSESDWAYQFSQERFGKSDVEIYRATGLLRRRTLLAHSIFLSDADCRAVVEAGASVSHCPLSNIYFANAAMPARRYLDCGVRIGLGTDIAGAPSPSVFRACLDAVSHSRCREDGTDADRPSGSSRGGVPGARITFLEAYWMATAGGGAALDAPVGLLLPGFEFDAVMVDAAVPDGDLFIDADLDSPRDRLEKIISLTARANVRSVWVRGAEVIRK